MCSPRLHVGWMPMQRETTWTRLLLDCHCSAVTTLASNYEVASFQCWQTKTRDDGTKPSSVRDDTDSTHEARCDALADATLSSGCCVVICDAEEDLAKSID
mmetsp:Transcript_4437/g.6400  ORF Transcript_4437/g.6400 Transcript_4437/m.6400 type:complete len:101 (+) Transcript_4437:592-894(+)